MPDGMPGGRPGGMPGGMADGMWNGSSAGGPTIEKGDLKQANGQVVWRNKIIWSLNYCITDI